MNRKTLFSGVIRSSLGAAFTLSRLNSAVVSYLLQWLPGVTREVVAAGHGVRGGSGRFAADQAAGGGMCGPACPMCRGPHGLARFGVHGVVTNRLATSFAPCLLLLAVGGGVHECVGLV